MPSSSSRSSPVRFSAFLEDTDEARIAFNVEENSQRADTQSKCTWEIIAHVLDAPSTLERQSLQGNRDAIRTDIGELIELFSERFAEQNYGTEPVRAVLTGHRLRFSAVSSGVQVSGWVSCHWRDCSNCSRVDAETLPRRAFGAVCDAFSGARS
jgi:hypothetical protein